MLSDGVVSLNQKSSVTELKKMPLKVFDTASFFCPLFISIEPEACFFSRELKCLLLLLVTLQQK